MNYCSTRDNTISVSAASAIVQGISNEGGLFVPTSLPTLGLEEIEAMGRLDYVGRACRVLAGFLSDFTPAEIRTCVEGAYGSRFDTPAVAPLSRLNDDTYLLELWHGPTCAFKDMALQLLPRLMTVSAQKVGEKREIVILVATSGDTGKAALEGFRDVPGTKMAVFYPENGVSPMQKLQMRTQEGRNVWVCGINGNFDDAQNGVKAIFTDRELADRLSENGVMLSSANSINWGRLVPQIVYYVSAYCDLLASEEIALGDKIDVVVPTGNFGNILAAYYAREMGLPIGRLVCASNRNDVLTEFLTTGVYDRNRPFYATQSPSMDILISSNLERLLWHLSDGNCALVRDLMSQLAQTGRYQVPEDLLSKLRELFAAGSCDDEQTSATIRRVFESHSYLLDTHTAVAVDVAEQYRAQGSGAKRVIASTANPYKFSRSVLQAVDAAAAAAVEDEFDVVDTVCRITGEPVPAGLSGLREKQVRFSNVCEKQDMLAAFAQGLGITL